MKLTPIASNQGVNPPTSNVDKAADARNRAIAKLTEVPVQNANQVSPEELTVVKPPQQESRQKNSTESQEATIQDSPQQAKPDTQATEKRDQLSNKFQQLAKREQALRAQARKQQQQIQEREAQIQAREAAIAAKEQEYLQNYIPKAKFKESPLEALAEAQISYDDLTQQLLTQQPMDPRLTSTIKSLEEKIAKLNAEIDNGKKAQEQAVKTQYDAALNQIRTDATALIRANPEQYEAIRATKSTNDVVELIQKTYEEEGRVMTVDEAADEVESYLTEEIDRLARIQKIQKLRSKASGSQPRASDTQPPSPKQQQQPMKTLTNATGSSRKLSARERAVMAFKGELK